ncbi:unnamed protein product, partial [Rotaria sp. Silwood1]
FDLVRKRLTKELKLLIENPTPGIRVVDDNSDMRKIRIDIEGASGTLYDGENFQLLFKFSDQYPFDSPQSRPPDNDWYVRTASNDPKKTRWWYHDDSV